MNILSIETSCDETAVSVVEATGGFPHASYKILGNALFSQIDIHREFGGVFPAVAKREHARTLVPMLTKALSDAFLLIPHMHELSQEEIEKLTEILIREPGLSEALTIFLGQYDHPKIDLIAVTSGPGLEPALWVGINFARALAHIWNIPVVSINHMEGHVLSSIFNGTILPDLSFPAVSLLISGGHTELVLLKDWSTYELIGQTRDDAVGEAFDKVARMLELPYPGGPEIGKLAEYAREKDMFTPAPLPRPMIDSDNFDFSFSGLKTAVRYAIDGKRLSHDEKAAMAREFEDAVTAVLLKKSSRAIEMFRANTFIVGGGVSANKFIRNAFSKHFVTHYPTLTLFVPQIKLSTDNSIMIALAGHARVQSALMPHNTDSIRADGNRSLMDERNPSHIEPHNI